MASLHIRDDATTNKPAAIVNYQVKIATLRQYELYIFYRMYGREKS